MKKLPIGIQDLATLINNDFLYVDKTENIHRLITNGVAYFLSRPRRFGKSLTVSTLKEIFSGNKELFKGLWIYDKINWKPYPVILISFNVIGFDELGLEKAIGKELDTIAHANGLHLTEEVVSQKFRELIIKLGQKTPVVILIDEYDKPIIDYIEDIPQAEKNRDILKNFYSVLKGSDKYIKFLFITGVSKFSKVSIFSDLNHLDDITLNENYGTLTGYTDQELDTYFPDFLKLAEDKLKGYFPNVRQEIKSWYNGYSWNGTDFVYNPFSLLGFFSNFKFEGFWFKTGTPTFLMNLIKKGNYPVMDLENIEMPSEAFNKYDIESLELTALLFQTGYLTIKSYHPGTGLYRIEFPNKEVTQAFRTQLLASLSEKSLTENTSLLRKITNSLQNNSIDQFIDYLKLLFKNITYPLIESKENYYHSIFYTVIKLLGFDIETEVLTSDGRIDAVVKTVNQIYVIEFKLGKAQSALEQMKKKQYHLKYKAEMKQIILLGIGFDTQLKNIGEYLIEEV